MLPWLLSNLMTHVIRQEKHKSQTGSKNPSDNWFKAKAEFNTSIHQKRHPAAFNDRKINYDLIRHELLSGKAGEKENIQQSPLGVVIWWNQWSLGRFIAGFSERPFLPPTMYVRYLCSSVFHLHGDNWFYDWRNAECLSRPPGIAILHDSISIQFLLFLAGGRFQGKNSCEISQIYNRNNSIHCSQSCGL